MNAYATTVSLSQVQVRSILEEWLNANLLRTPHQVTDIDYITDTGLIQFNIGLLPLPASTPVVTGVTGHSGNGSRPAEEAQSAQPAATPKRRHLCTEADKAEILRRRAAGERPGVIATAVGYSEPVIFRVIKEAGASHAA